MRIMFLGMLWFPFFFHWFFFNVANPLIYMGLELFPGLLPVGFGWRLLYTVHNIVYVWMQYWLATALWQYSQLPPGFCCSTWIHCFGWSTVIRRWSITSDLYSILKSNSQNFGLAPYSLLHILGISFCRGWDSSILLYESRYIVFSLRTEYWVVLLGNRPSEGFSTFLLVETGSIVAVGD